MKELERQQLRDTLHKDVMRKIIFLQRWFRARLQRKEFLDMREAAILIQVNKDYVNVLRIYKRVPILAFRRELKYNIDLACPVPCPPQFSWRRYCKEEQRRQAATRIQAVWRGYRQRSENYRQRSGATKIQALVRGHSARKR